MVCVSFVWQFNGTQICYSSSVSFSLLSLNFGTPHPEAVNRSLAVPCLGKSMRGQTESLACIVWEEILVVQLFDGLTKFYFVDWRNGIVFAVSFWIPHPLKFEILRVKLFKNMLRKSASARIHNLCRLGRTKFAFIEYDYNAWPQRYTLFIYSVDPQGNASSTPDHLATFNFPSMSLRTAPLTVIHSSFPPAPSRHLHIIQKKPNFISHASGIVQLRMIFTRSTSPFGFQVFVSPDVLLRAEKGQDGRPSVHTWDEWGPTNTRWIKDPLGRLTPTIRPYGYRVGFVDRILDFNPCEVARDICHGSSVGVENLSSRIVREPTVIFTSEAVRQNIVSSLPYRETLCVVENMSQSALSYVDEDLYFIEVCLRSCCISFSRADPRCLVKLHRNGTATIRVCTI